MSNPPWMPFYIDDYIADTTHLDAAQHGAYLLLIMAYWKRGCLPSDDAQLARIARLSPRQWESNKAVIASLFSDGWKHKRIDAELDKAHAKSIARSDAGKNGAAAKALKNNNQAKAIASDLLEQKPADAQASSPDTREVSIPKIVETESLSVQNERTRPKPIRRNNYPDDFEEFWKAYPTDANMAKKEAFPEWQKLSPEERELAMKSLPSFNAYCRKNKDYRPVHAVRYLRNGRFEGHAAVANETAKRGIYIQPDTSQWEAWEQHYRRTKGIPPPRDDKGGWHFPTEWPPVLSVVGSTL